MSSGLDQGDIIILAIAKKLFKAAVSGIGTLWVEDGKILHIPTADGSQEVTIDFGDILPKYKDKPPTTDQVGGLPAGSDVNGMTIAEVQEKFLWAYRPPSVRITTEPNITLQEKGTSLSNVKITAHITNPNKEPEHAIQWVKFFVGGSLVHTATAPTADQVTYTHPAVLNSDTAFKVEITDGTNSPSASKTIKWVNRSFYGTVPEGTPVSVQMIEGLQNNVLKDVKALRYDGITAVNSLIVYAYPRAFGNVTSIVDRMNLQCLTSYTLHQIERRGETYNVYVLTDASSTKDVLQNFT